MSPSTPWTAEQRAILDHPSGGHALVRAVPGAGKTTTLVGRVVRLCERGVLPRRIRVVMFNRAIEESFRERLAGLGIRGVRVNTFDSLGLEVLRVAAEQRLLQRELIVVPDGTEQWSREIFKRNRGALEDEEQLADAIAFWKAHLVSPARAAFPGKPALVDAYRQFEELRLSGGALRVAFADMVYTAVRVLKDHPRLLGPVDHFLVDEFQDTNLARVTLLQRLSHGRTEIMAVGDEDQAINEWCGAHPRFFREFAALFPWAPAREYPLSHSFRFGRTLAGAAARLIRHNESRDHVEIVGAGACEGAIVDTHDVPRTIAALRAEGVLPRDIAVLYRSRGQGVGVLAGLAAARVPMHTDDFERLRRSRAADVALGYLRFATSDARPSMQDAWRIVHGPDRFIQKETFARQLALRGSWGLAAVLADRELARELGQPPSAVAAMAELAETLQWMGRCATAGEALDVLNRRIDVEAQIAAVMASERQRELSGATFAGFCAFVRGLDVTPARAAQAVESFDPTFGEPDDRRIWVSTIHKAKGKEWRCVILPALGDGLCPAEERGAVPGTVHEPDGIEQSAWLEQERRIFYVGLTRASERVYLQPLVSQPSRFLLELRPPEPPIRRRPAEAAPPGSILRPAPRPTATKRREHAAQAQDVADASSPGRERSTPAKRRRAGPADAPIVVHRALPVKRRRATSATEPPASDDPDVDATATRTAQGRTWRAAEEQALAEAWQRGDDLAALAERFGRSVGAIAHRVVRLGLADDLDAVMLRRAD